MVNGKLREKYKRIRYVNLVDEKLAPKKFYDFRSQIMRPGSQFYNLRQQTKRQKKVDKDKVRTSKEELRRKVKNYELSGEVQFIKQSKVRPSKTGNWDKNRLPCPKCNIDICLLPGWSCDNVCCRNCLHSFCWQCGESLATNDWEPCSKRGFYLAKLSNAVNNKKSNVRDKFGHKCTHCSTKWSTRSGLLSHMRMHFRCWICSRGYSTKARLMFHIGGHKNKGLFKCFQNPAVVRNATLRCMESDKTRTTKKSRRALRKRKKSIIIERKNGLSARKILFPVKQRIIN